MRYTKITVDIHSDDRPPYFMGSQLRGALGYALKKVVCINPKSNCDGCFALNSCLYYEFYEEKNSFHKFRFDILLAQEKYNFSIYLFDNATEKIPYILGAIINMLKSNGFGREQKTYNDFDIFINDTLATKNEDITIPSDPVKLIEIGEIKKDIRLDLITPLRIKRDSLFLRDDRLDLNDLITSIYQRQMRLLGKNFKKFPYPIEGEIVSKDLRYQELTRSSNRQKTTMKLGGLMGSLMIKNLNKESYDVLRVGEYIAVGKQTVFGLGKIRIKDIDG